LQTYCTVAGFGAKKKGGGDLKPEDLWSLISDAKDNKNPWGEMTIEEKRAWYKKIQEKHTKLK